MKPAVKRKQPQKATPEESNTIPAEMNGAQLAGLLDMPHATVRDVCGRAGVAVEKGKYNVRQAILAAQKHFRSKSDAIHSKSAEAKARREQAEADSAEEDALQKMGRTCLMTDAVQFWSEARIEIRQTIETAEYLTAKQRERLLTQIAALHPTPPNADRG